MPIYEYECGQCGKFEALQKITEEPLKVCEKCGRPVHRLVSLSSFTLVGGGWYKDLYGSTNNTAGTSHTHGSSSSKDTSSAKESSSTASSGSSNTAKSETKSSKPSTAAA